MSLLDRIQEGRGPSAPRVPLEDRVLKVATKHHKLGHLDRSDYNYIVSLLKRKKVKGAIANLVRAFENKPKKWTKRNFPRDVIELENTEYFGEESDMSLLDRITEAEREESHTPEERRRITVAFMGLKRAVMAKGHSGKDLKRFGMLFKNLEDAIKKLG